MATRAIQLLKKKKVPFEVIKYEHREKGAEFAAGATGFALKKTVKTLVIKLDHKNYCLALLPGDRRLNLKSLAKVFKVKRPAMADTAAAQRLTGYLVGGISPFGTKQQFEVVADASIIEFDEVLINAGQRGTMLKMSPRDIVALLKCRLAEIGN